ncbi:MAG: hypothetical protein EPO26_11465 [Chloroflexota bacterium]|nr:MAG: hypothetical protein EPO26_11465 [Chloroflexota bacterium]
MPGRARIALDTLLDLTAPIVRALPRGLLDSAPMRRALQGAPWNEKSYDHDWLAAFVDEPSIDATPCNLASILQRTASLRRIREYDLIVILHSAMTGGAEIVAEIAGRLADRRGPLLLFVGNEFRQMPAKIRLAQTLAAEFIATQLTLAAGRWLYAPVTSAQVLSGLHALNPNAYTPGPEDRPIDIGFRGDAYDSFLLGDRDRELILAFAQSRAAAHGLTVDIAFGRTYRDRWIAFLQSSHGTVGAEAGTHFLERDDRTQGAVAAFRKDNPGASFDAVFDRFFRDHPRPASGKTLSSRHFEAIGTKTCQILVSGKYSGVLTADAHYIAVRNDFSNIDECFRRFADRGERERIAGAALEYVLAGHTHSHRVRSILRQVTETPGIAQNHTRWDERWAGS